MVRAVAHADKARTLGEATLRDAGSSGSSGSPGRESVLTSSDGRTEMYPETVRPALGGGAATLTATTIHTPFPTKYHHPHSTHPGHMRRAAAFRGRPRPLGTHRWNETND
ncbi:hypothetical protein ZHAS_00016496 [Anopheles sinensis]|uniref:Uncharacterized protein n=1 Tax=Anopheles sinensis TaxID=74873 RepID=A0A084WDT1_ANOSI|nr:hypothetical protein ZHAS_00016496 [Anopheles sinensis]